MIAIDALTPALQGGAFLFGWLVAMVTGLLVSQAL